MEQDRMARAQVQAEAWAARAKEEEREVIARDQGHVGCAYARIAVQLLNISEVSPVIRWSAPNAEPKW